MKKYYDIYITYENNSTAYARISKQTFFQMLQNDFEKIKNITIKQ